MADNSTDRFDEQSSRTGWDPAAKPAPQDQPLFREQPDERADAVRAQADAERQRLVAERAARREARLAALAPTPEPVTPVPDVPARSAGSPSRVASPATTGATASSARPMRAEVVRVTERTTDKFAGSLGLFVLRLVVAAIVGIRGLYHLLNLPQTTELIQSTVLPYPAILAIVVGAAEVAIAIALVFGLLTRLAGLGLALLTGVALGFVLWGPWNPFTAGEPGFTGELELLLLAVGVLFLLVGGGGWAVDRGFRSRRSEPDVD